MAKIKFGMMMTDARGKLGGQVFSKNKGGAYVRTKVTPNNPQTSFQSAVRSILSTLAAGWRALTAAQIDAWNSAVTGFQKTNIFGDLITPSGEQLYIRLNANLSKIGAANITSPPAPSAVDGLDSLSLAAAVTGTLVTVTFAPTVPAAHAMVVRLTPQFSPGISNFKNKLRDIVVLAAATTSPYAAYAAWNARYGTLTEGQKIGVEAYLVSTVTGLQSGTLKADAIVAA